MLRTIIFDLDGVLADSHPAHKKAWGELLGSVGQTVSAQELEYVVEGRKRDEIMRHFLGELSNEQIREYGLKKDSLFAKYSSDLQPIAGVRNFINAVHTAGIAMAVASSAGRKRVESNLRHLKLSQFFSAVITGDDVIKGKPDPALFIQAEERLNIAPEGILVCEDAVNGVQAAKAAGMKCLGIASAAREVLLKAAGADRIACDFTKVSLADVESLFDSHRRSHTATAP